MTTMSRLENATDRQVQDLLRKTDFVTLAVSLLGASEAARKRVFGNLSAAASSRLDQAIRAYEKLDARELLIQTSADRLDSLL